MNIKRFLAENEQAIFYETSFSRSVTKYARQEDLHNSVTLDGWRCVLATEKRTGVDTYLLLDENNSIMCESLSCESMCLKIDMIKRLRL